MTNEVCSNTGDFFLLRMGRPKIVAVEKSKIYPSMTCLVSMAMLSFALFHSTLASLPDPKADTHTHTHTHTHTRGKIVY
jgi:hypothetical protein